MKVISIHQPAYLPWLGYFHKIMLSDVFVFLDAVQFEKNSFTNRNRILTSAGPIWLTVPLLMKGHTQKIMTDMQILPDERWKKKHLSAIQMNYSAAPYFKEIFPVLEAHIMEADRSFCDFAYGMTKDFLKLLKVKTEFVRASSLGVEGVKNILIQNICRYFKADIYISGILGRDYIKTEEFDAIGIKVIVQEYQHPVYPQLHKSFEKAMGVVDLLMNVGPQNARDIILSGNTTRQQLEGECYAAQS